MKKNKNILKKKKKRNKKLKKIDDSKNQNLSIIFEDIISHRREVKEIEELTFKQLQNLRKKLEDAIRKKNIIPFSEEEKDSKEKEE